MTALFPLLLTQWVWWLPNLLCAPFARISYESVSFSEAKISLPLKIVSFSVDGEVQSNREETIWDPLGDHLEHRFSALVKSRWHSKITPRRLGKAPMPRPHPNQENQDLWKQGLSADIFFKKLLGDYVCPGLRTGRLANVSWQMWDCYQ